MQTLHYVCGRDASNDTAGEARCGLQDGGEGILCCASGRLLPQVVLLPLGCGEAYFLGNGGDGACVEQGE